MLSDPLSCSSDIRNVLVLRGADLFELRVALNQVTASVEVAHVPE